jgi:hypothetical protein
LFALECLVKGIRPTPALRSSGILLFACKLG